MRWRRRSVPAAAWTFLSLVLGSDFIAHHQP
jgi:hypothetical protein